jgi:hypothetical protein
VRETGQVSTKKHSGTVPYSRRARVRSTGYLVGFRERGERGKGLIREGPLAVQTGASPHDARVRGIGHSYAGVTTQAVTSLSTRGNADGMLFTVLISSFTIFITVANADGRRCPDFSPEGLALRCG